MGYIVSFPSFLLHLSNKSVVENKEGMKGKTADEPMVPQVPIVLQVPKVSGKFLRFGVLCHVLFKSVCV